MPMKAAAEKTKTPASKKKPATAKRKVSSRRSRGVQAPSSSESDEGDVQQMAAAKSEAAKNEDGKSEKIKPDEGIEDVSSRSDGEGGGTADEVPAEKRAQVAGHLEGASNPANMRNPAAAREPRSIIEDEAEHLARGGRGPMRFSHGKRRVAKPYSKEEEDAVMELRNIEVPEADRYKVWKWLMSQGPAQVLLDNGRTPRDLRDKVRRIQRRERRREELQEEEQASNAKVPDFADRVDAWKAHLKDVEKLRALERQHELDTEHAAKKPRRAADTKVMPEYVLSLRSRGAAPSNPPLHSAGHHSASHRSPPPRRRAFATRTLMLKCPSSPAPSSRPSCRGRCRRRRSRARRPQRQRARACSVVPWLRGGDRFGSAVNLSAQPIYTYTKNTPYPKLMQLWKSGKPRSLSNVPLFAAASPSSCADFSTAFACAGGSVEVWDGSGPTARIDAMGGSGRPCALQWAEPNVVWAAWEGGRVAAVDLRAPQSAAICAFRTFRVLFWALTKLAYSYLPRSVRAGPKMSRPGFVLTLLTHAIRLTCFAVFIIRSCPLKHLHLPLNRRESNAACPSPSPRAFLFASGVESGNYDICGLP